MRRRRTTARCRGARFTEADSPRKVAGQFSVRTRRCPWQRVPRRALVYSARQAGQRDALRAQILD
jgi:hypothetical protein